jgi:hypothetical protein
MQDEQPAPPERSSGGTFLLFALAFCVSVVGAIWYYLQHSDKPVVMVGKDGFDLSEVAKRAEQAGGATAQTSQKSGLGMIGSISGMQFGQTPQAAGSTPAFAATTAQTITQLIKTTERAMIDLAYDYTKRYPVIREYGHDWMHYPDLRKLNDEYMRTHDPFAFMKGLASAPNFGVMVKKYGTQPAVRNFVMEAVKKAPPEAMPTAAEYVSRNDSLKQLTDTVATSLGLPPGLLGTPQQGKLDAGKLTQQLQNANPNPAP